MAKLPKFTLDYDQKTQRWSLEKDRTSEVIKTFKLRMLRQKAESSGRFLAKTAVR